MTNEHAGNWRATYLQHSGKGSMMKRARDVRSIYESVAPIPRAIPEREASEYVDILRKLFREAAEEFGAKFIS
jgi:hypothetical protein